MNVPICIVHYIIGICQALPNNCDETLLWCMTGALVLSMSHCNSMTRLAIGESKVISSWHGGGSTLSMKAMPSWTTSSMGPKSSTSMSRGRKGHELETDAPTKEKKTCDLGTDVLHWFLVCWLAKVIFAITRNVTWERHSNLQEYVNYSQPEPRE